MCGIEIVEQWEYYQIWIKQDFLDQRAMGINEDYWLPCESVPAMWVSLFEEMYGRTR